MVSVEGAIEVVVLARSSCDFGPVWIGLVGHLGARTIGVRGAFGSIAPEHEVGWLHVALEWLLWFVLLAVKLKLTKYIVLVVMGPLFAAVSEAVEAQIHGHTMPFSLRRWIHDTFQGHALGHVVGIV